MALPGQGNTLPGLPLPGPPSLGGLPPGQQQKSTTTASETSMSTFTVSITTSSTTSSTASTAISSAVITFVPSTSSSVIFSTGSSNMSPTQSTSFLSDPSTTPSGTLNINVSVNVSVTATLSVPTASAHPSSSNRNLPSSPAGAIAANSNNTPLTAIAGVAVGISAFLFLAVFILFLLWFYRRKRRREADNRARDSWANSSIQPEVFRDAGPSMRRTPVLKSPAIPNMGLYSPIPQPNNPFSSNDERAALVGFAPSIPQPPQRVSGRRTFHGEVGGIAGGGVVPGGNAFAGNWGEPLGRPRSAPGNVNGNAGPNRNMWRSPSDLTPPIEVPEPPYDDATTALPQMPKRDASTRLMNPLVQNPPTQPGTPTSPNVRINGRRSGSRGSNRSLTPGGQDLPESLGRLNRWLEDNRRRSQIE